MDASSIAFWGILGGMSLICVVVVLVVYFICFSRNKSGCMSSENDDLLETTIHHEEVHTVTSETRTNVGGKAEPEVVHRTEQISRVSTTKQRSRGNISQTSLPVTKISVSPRNNETSDSRKSGRSDCSDFNGRCFENTFVLTRPGESRTTSIGTPL